MVVTAALSQVFFVFKLLLYGKHEIVGYKKVQASICKCVDYEQSLFFLAPSSKMRVSHANDHMRD